jgi:hypothetical protein
LSSNPKSDSRWAVWLVLTPAILFMLNYAYERHQHSLQSARFERYLVDHGCALDGEEVVGFDDEMGEEIVNLKFSCKRGHIETFTDFRRMEDIEAEMAESR